MVLPQQETDHQIQPETRMDHGTRAPVLEPYPRNVPGALSQESYLTFSCTRPIFKNIEPEAPRNRRTPEPAP